MCRSRLVRTHYIKSGKEELRKHICGAARFSVLSVALGVMSVTRSDLLTFREPPELFGAEYAGGRDGVVADDPVVRVVHEAGH